MDNKELVRLLESSDPEAIFLGINLLVYEEKSPLINMTIRKALLRIKNISIDFLEDHKNEIADIIEQISPEYFWGIIDNLFYLEDSLERI